MLLHLRTCINLKRQLRVQLQRLSKQQVLALTCTPKSGNDLKCPTCNNTFEDSDSLNAHKCIEQEAPTLKCQYCGVYFWSAALMKCHVGRHFSVLPGFVNCVRGTCRYIFADVAELKQHVIRHATNWGLFIKCCKCNKRFGSKVLLKKHMRAHFVERTDNPTLAQITCQYCDSNVASSTLDQHLELHQTDTPGVIKCLYQHCQAQFSSLNELKEHCNSHKTFNCIKCGVFCRTSDELEKHILVHSEERPFRCDVPSCFYAGKLAKNLEAHKKNKHDNKIVACHLCGKLLKQERNLKRHLELHETDAPGVLKCLHGECAATRFSSIDVLKIHYMQRHVKKMHAKQAV